MLLMTNAFLLDVERPTRKARRLAGFQLVHHQVSELC